MEQIFQEIKDHFKALTFDEEKHKYFVDGQPLETSVSGKIKNFVEYVDFDEKALNKDRRLGLPEGTHKKLWDNKSNAACAKGDKVHFFGEMYAFHRQLEPTCKQEEAVVKFWNDLPPHIVVAFTELQM